MSMRLSFCVKAATTLDADDLDTLTTGIEGYVKTGVDERQAEKMALDDLIAEVAKERAAIVSLAREQYPELFAGVAAERVGPVEAPAAESATPEPAPAAVEAPKANEKIEDIGEKIGGARKDTAVSTGPGRARSNEDDRPAWARRFDVRQIVKPDGQINAPRDEGRWVIYDKRSLDWTGQPKQVGRTTYATKEEADATIPIAAVSLKHRVIMASTKKGEPDRYEIWRDITDRKRVKVVEQQFDSREAAMAYMLAHAVEIVETNTTFGEADLPLPPDRARTGPERRTGDVKGDDFKEQFGFRGVEFGNWNNQDERQALMNDAWDGLMDLADVLGVPPRALGLNGDLALAFGARGQGLQSARAHYERDRAVINLTKERGAGSLAHEFFHGLDHYFGRQDGKASAKWEVQPDGTRTLKAGDPEQAYVSSGFSGNRSGVRPELRAAYDKLLSTIFKKAQGYVEDTAKADKFTGVAREELAQRLDELRKDLSEQKDPRYYTRNNKPASAEVLAEFDTIAAKMVAGELLETDWRTFRGTAKRAALSARWTNDTLERLSALYKEVRGRSGFNAEKFGVLDKLRSSMERYSQRLKMLADAQTGAEKTKMVPTDFAMNAKELDQGRGTDYWTTPHEMAARAFQGYVEDKIAERGGASRFLNYAPENIGIPTPWGFKRPFPAGNERKAINKALDEFVGALKVRTDEAGNVAMFSRAPQTESPDAWLYRFWSSRTWDSEADARDMMRRRIVEDNERYAGMFKPNDPALVDGLEFVRAPASKSGFNKGKQQVKLKQPKAQPAPFARIGEPVDSEGGDRPRVDWESTDMNDDGTPESVLQAYGRGHGNVYRAWVDPGDIPAPKGSGIVDGYPDMQGDYDWSELQRGRGSPPPLKLRVGKNGKLVLMDGNHRLAWWREQGVSEVPAYVIDERPQAMDVPFSRTQDTTRGLSLDEAEAIVGAVREANPTAPLMVVMQSPRDLSPGRDGDLYDRIVSRGAQNDVEAAYHEGKVYVFANHLASPERAMFVIAHHELRHHGMRSLYGKRLGTALEIMRASNARLAAAAQAKVDAELATDLIEGTEEALADMDVAEIQALKGWPKLVAAVRDWLRGFAQRLRAKGHTTLADAIDPKEWTDADVAAFVARAEAVSKGGRAKFGTDGTVFQRAWHGTAARGIDRFSTDYLGSGTGAQAFGWGLYFGGRREVGEYYRKLATDGKATGQLYGVEIPEDSELLDWNKPLSAQPEGVRERLEPWLKTWRDGMRQTLRTFSPAEIEQEIKLAEKELDGQGVYQAIGLEKGGDKQASMFLLERGVPGIKYRGKAAFDRGSAGPANYVIFDGAHTEVQEAVYSRAPRSMAERRAAAQEAQQGLTAFSRAAPRTAHDMVWEVVKSANTPAKARAAFLGATENINRFNLWDKTIGTQLNMARKNPYFARVFEAFQQQQDDTAAFAIEAEAEAVDVMARMGSGKEIVSSLKATVTGERSADLAAVSKAIFSNIEGERGVQQKVFTDEELTRDFGLNERQISQYRQARAAIDQSLDRYAQSLVVRAAQKFVGTEDVRRAGLDETVEAVLERLKFQRGSIEEARDADPINGAREFGNLTPAEQIELTHASATKLLDKKIEALDAAIEQIPDIQKTANDLKDAGYSPAMRFGNYSVTATARDGTVEFFTMVDSKLQANVLRMQLRKELPNATVTAAAVDQESFKIFGGVSPDTVELFAKFMEVDQTDAFKEFVALAASSRSALKRMLERKGVAGFSQNLPQVLAAFITSNSRAAARNLNGEEIAAAMESVQKNARGDVSEQAAKLHQYMANPSDDGAKIRGFMFAYYLGGSVASALVNITQPVMMTAPYLHQFAGNKVAGIMGRAAKTAATGETTNAALKSAMIRAAKEGVTDTHEYYQMMQEAGGSGNVPVRAAMKAWGAMFGAAERFNRKITFAAAFEVAQGMTAAQLKANGAVDAYTFAKRAVDETQGVYARHNRPNWARGTAGALLMTFKQYSVAYIEFFSRLPTKQKLLALAMLILMAGLEGLPFAEDLEDLIDTIGQKMGYDTNSKRTLRLAATNLFGEAGAEFALHGISGLSGMPMDVAGRLGMGNLIPGTRLFNPSATDKGREVLEIAGPAGGLAKKALEAFDQADPSRAYPTAFANAAKAIVMFDTGQYRDGKNKRVQDVDGMDAAMKLIGFQPQSVAAGSRKITEQIRDVDTAKRVESEIVNEWAEGIRSKDPEAVAAARERLKQWNEDNPNLPIRIRLSQVFAKVKAANLTRDARFMKTAPPELRARLLAEAQ